MSDNQFNNNQPIKLELTDEKFENLGLKDVDTELITQDHLHNLLAEKTKQQELITEVALRIRQSLNLQDILDTAVREVQNILDCDRVVIYRFAADLSGDIVAESVKPGWKNLLGEKIIDTFFQAEESDKYKRGKTLAINDVHKAQFSRCHLTLLAKFQVKAIVVVPILPTPSPSALGGSRLWGLLIAHHCYETYRWQEEEVELLDKLAVQLSIAIQQAELLNNLQNELEQRKQAEQALRESEARFYGAFQSAAIGMAIVSLKGKWLGVNPALCQMLGYSQAELQQTTFQAITYPDDLDTDLNYVDMLLQGHVDHYQMEKRYIHKQGKLIWINLSVSLVRDELNQPLYIVKLIENITQRKQAEQALRESEQRYRNLYHNTPVMLHSIDSTGKIISVSDYWLKCLGYEEREVIGKKYFEFLTKESRLYAQEIVLPQFSEISTCIDVPYQFICKNGTIIDVLLSSIAQTDNSGTVIASLAVMVDVTKRNQAEAAIKQAKKKLHQANLKLEQRVEERTEELLEAKEAAETANQAKDHFLAHISHELRTPLNSILGFTQILQKDLNLKGNQQQNIQLIRQSGKHLLALINDILDFSKITAQKLVLEPKDFCFSSFLDDLASLIRQQAQQNNLSFNYQRLSKLPNIVRGDETRLKQVLINLLGNAIKFTSEGGVSLRVGYIKDFVKDFDDRQSDSSAIENNNKIRFEVEDTGIGIPEDKLETILLPFEQVSNNLANKKGTGLGLTITDNILQLMDSKIRLESTLGKGSIFYFDLDLPSIDSDIVRAPLSQLSIPIGFSGERRKILVVDDIPANLHLLSSWLKPLGFEIAEAKNGEEGLEITRSFQPDAILVDLMMPVMNGIEMASKVRQEPQLKDIIMIAVSANVQFSDCIKFDRELFTNFLSKPIDLNQLLNLLGDYLQLEWIEAENNKNKIDTSTESLVFPSIEIIEELLNLSKLGDMNELIQQTTLLEQSDKQYSLFVQRIEQLASNYEQNNLLKLLENLKLKNRSEIESGF